MKKLHLSSVILAMGVFLISSSIVLGQGVIRPKPIIVPPRTATPPGGNQPPGGGGGGANVPNNYSPPTGSSDTVKSKSPSPGPVPGADAGKAGSPFRGYMEKHNIP